MIAETERLTSLAAFIDEHDLTMTARPTTANHAMEDFACMAHWRCIIRKADAGRRMIVTFSMGVGHGGRAPTLPEVLACLADEAAAVENSAAFEDWAWELGFDPDSPTGFRVYQTVLRQTERLKSLLGAHYEALLWETERE